MGTRLETGTAWCGLITILAVIAAGCGGGGGRLSTRDYAHEAGVICERANWRMATITIPSLSDRRVAERDVSTAAEIQSRAASDLRALRPPQNLRDIDAIWIALVDQSANELYAMASSLRHGKLEAATEEGRNATRLTKRAGELITPLGITWCRGPGFGAI